MGYFTAPLHFSFGMKSGIYNVKVIAKCLDLLDSSSLSFTGIREANLAFSAYEHLDQKGIKADRHTLMRALKMCGMAIAPQKLSVHLMQRRGNGAEAGRMQLYEFLDLLVLCEPRESIFLHEARVSSTAKTPRQVYELDDMRSLLVTPDEKLALHLNQQHKMNEQWLFPREAVQLKKSPTSHLASMRTPLKEARRPSQQAGALSARTKDDERQEKWTLVTPVPHLTCHCYTPKKVTLLLSEEDIETTRREREDLQYQMETLAERAVWELNWKMDYYMPGYRERAASRPKAATPPEPKPPARRKPPGPDVFKRLSAPRRRCPSPCNAKLCDAYKQGIAPKRVVDGHLEPDGPQDVGACPALGVTGPKNRKTKIPALFPLKSH
ncbi:uncharacterized protein [Ambystoma mexicanum]